jgi:uncharacterized membrane protein YkvA (DUF1232 family)
MNYRFVRDLMMRNPTAMWRVLAHAPNFLKLFGRLFGDRRVPWYLKALPGLGIVYLVVPVDLLFDFLVPWGWTDDLVVLGLTFWLFVKLCPQRVVEEHVRLIDEGG